jgi:hypothetical protein
MAGLVPAIHVLLEERKKDVDARAKRGHDESMFTAAGHLRHVLPLLLPQPHPRRVSIGELDAGFLEHTLNCRQIVARRHATSLKRFGTRCWGRDSDLAVESVDARRSYASIRHLS